MAQIANKKNFDDLTTGKLTIVDFWAPWCAPCKMMEPVLDQLEEEFNDQVNFVKMNVDEGQDIAERYKVMSIPSLVVFKDGTAKEKLTGLFSKDKLARYVEKKINESV
ncbi:thioredoxin [Paucilactobacillus suebicus]|uniref:Thioredoxin n=1 Tax=Paucilactobacillus suebicus DSM 5007 = KCTC 3549 TaxID=1423807 RepID=A0A0R1W693_9LACO|nr:thioredoxin [Paucilactobacillus suebicus]KRM12994.1 thioredoxin [Paucilactobacillus suebicus DSM 5007 = KCTC 3549]